MKISMTIYWQDDIKDDYEDYKHSFKRKDFSQNFISDFIGELTCKSCGKTFTYKINLKDHLMNYKNKRQFKCQHDGCDKKHQI